MSLSNKIDLQKQTQEFSLQINGLKYDIPCLFLKALKDNVDTVVIFVHGLNGTKNSLQFISGHLENAHLIGYDAKSCGDNKNPATNHYFQYAIDLKNIVLTLKEELKDLNIKKYYIIGESFGAAVSIMFYKRFQDLINGILIWNMPRKVIDVSQSTAKERFKMAGPLVYSLITNLPTFRPAPSPVEKLSNNRSLILATKIKMPNAISDNRSIIAAWLGNYKAWRILLSKKFIKKATKNIAYISSKDDLLQDKKAIIELDAALKQNNSTRIIHFALKQGTHVLFYDQYMGKFLVNAIDEFVLLSNKEDLNKFKTNLNALEDKYEKKE